MKVTTYYSIYSQTYLEPKKLFSEAASGYKICCSGGKAITIGILVGEAVGLAVPLKN